MFPDLTEMVVKAKIDDIMREAERDRLGHIAHQTATAYGEKRKGFRRLFGANARLRPTPATPPTLVREPAV
jgi:hypothetical protein